MDKLKRIGLITLGWVGIITTIFLYYIAIAPLFLLFK